MSPQTQTEGESGILQSYMSLAASQSSLLFNNSNNNNNNKSSNNNNNNNNFYRGCGFQWRDNDLLFLTGVKNLITASSM